jgi:hypothetical protein
LFLLLARDDSKQSKTLYANQWYITFMVIKHTKQKVDNNKVGGSQQKKSKSEGPNKKKVVCVARELNPDLLLGRQQC